MINAFLLAGQSNMAGRGGMDGVEPMENEMVLMFRDSSWVAAREPLHLDRPEAAGIGPGMSFAGELAVKHGRPVGLIPCAVGGSSLDEWVKGAPLYETAVRTALEASSGAVMKGILWHQGESDSTDADRASRYKEKLSRVITDFRGDLGFGRLPFIAGELGEFLAGWTKGRYFRTVNEALGQLSSEDEFFALVSSSRLEDKGDNLHFNAESMREFGRRYALAWEECAGRLGIRLE